MSCNSLNLLLLALIFSVIFSFILFPSLKIDHSKCLQKKYTLFFDHTLFFDTILCYTILWPYTDNHFWKVFNKKLSAYFNSCYLTMKLQVKRKKSAERRNYCRNYSVKAKKKGFRLKPIFSIKHLISQSTRAVMSVAARNDRIQFPATIY